jgi:hypothetical protein
MTKIDLKVKVYSVINYCTGVHPQSGMKTFKAEPF